MKVIFVNSRQERCGVHQYGLRLFKILQKSQKLECRYVVSPDSHFSGELDWAEVVIYNQHPGIHNAVSKAPFGLNCREIGIFHEAGAGERFKELIFSDPTRASVDGFYAIGRPLPDWKVIPHVSRKNCDEIVVGVNGLCGAWCTTMIAHVASQLPECRVRMALPPSDHVDPSGVHSQMLADSCGDILGNPRKLEITYDFMDEPSLLAWMSENDINCYIRPSLPSHGISSILDLALAVRRPIAINRHPMFRHLHDCKPSICVEDTSMRDIVGNGLSPLIPHYERNSNERVLSELESILLK